VSRRSVEGNCRRDPAHPLISIPAVADGTDLPLDGDAAAHWGLHPWIQPGVRVATRTRQGCHASPDPGEIEPQPGPALPGQTLGTTQGLRSIPESSGRRETKPLRFQHAARRCSQPQQAAGRSPWRNQGDAIEIQHRRRRPPISGVPYPLSENPEISD